MLPENANTESTHTNSVSNETERVDMQDKSDKVNIGEDIPIFTGDDSEPENSFPTFYIHGVNECLSLWTMDVEDYMYEINSEMRRSASSMDQSFNKMPSKEQRKLQDIS